MLQNKITKDQVWKQPSWLGLPNFPTMPDKFQLTRKDQPARTFVDLHPLFLLLVHMRMLCVAACTLCIDCVHIFIQISDRNYFSY